MPIDEKKWKASEKENHSQEKKLLALAMEEYLAKGGIITRREKNGVVRYFQGTELKEIKRK